MNGGNFEYFPFIRWWQQTRQAAGEHGFAGARWPKEQQVVPTGGGDFQRPFGLELAAHIAQVQGAGCVGQGLSLSLEQVLPVVQVGADLQEAGRAINAGAGTQCRFGSVVGAEDHCPLGVTTGQGGGQGGSHRAQFARERQFTEKFVVAELRQRNLAGGGEYAQGNGQVKTSALFGQVGGGQVDGDASRGKFQMAIKYGRAHPVLAFFYGSFGQANNGQARQAVGQVYLNGNQRGGDAQFGAGIDDGE